MWLLIDEWSQEPHYKPLWQTHAEFPSAGFGAPLPPLTEVTTQTTYDQEMSQTYKWQMAISRWNIHREPRLRNTKLFPPVQMPLSPSVRLLLGLRPIMPCTVCRLPQHLPNNAAHAQLSLGSLRKFKAFIGCFFLLHRLQHLFPTHSYPHAAVT